MSDAGEARSGQGPLDGVRVVEVPGGRAVAYCAQLFAQSGADVVRLEPPSGDEIRGLGPFPGDRPDPEQGGMHRVLNAGKRSVIADLGSDEGSALADELISSCHVLLTNWQRSAEFPLLTPERIAARHPDVTYASISPFGATGPYAEYRADSHVQEALSGFSYVTGAPDREPLSMGVEVADYFAGVCGFVAALAALLERRRGHPCHFVDTSALESLTLADDHTLSVYATMGAVRRRYYSRVLIFYPMDLMRCADGSIAFVPGAVNFADAVARLIERPELADHPVFVDPAARVFRWREFDAFVKPWLESHSVAEVMERARKLRLAFGTVMDARDLVADEHLRGRGALVELPDGGLAMGPAFRFSQAPARALAAPALGEHQSRPWARPQRSEPVSDPASGGYFEGLRVVDLSRVWAGPLVTRTLADLGADVIKVERADAPEGMRGGFPSANDTSGDYWNRSAYFAARNAGKRTLSLDLTAPEGRAIVHRMLDAADVLVENFTPGVMEKFGLDYETLRQRYPRLVMVSISGYGQHGPRKKDPAFGLSIEPAAGISVVTGYEGEEPTQSGNTLLDSLAGMHATAGLLAALIARERSGRGQWVDVSMQEVALQMSAPHIMDFAINGRLASTAGNRRSGSVRGTYPCRGDDEWVAVSAQGEEAWRALCAVAGQPQWTDDPRFEDCDQRDSNHDELDRLLAAWTRGLTKFEVMESLQAAGVGAGALLKADEIFSNDQLAARGFFGPSDLPGYGEIPLQRFCPALFDGQGFNARVRVPLLGEHTHELLTELGLGPREIEELRVSGVTEPELAAFEAPAARQARRLPLESLLEQGSLHRIDANYREIVRRALAAQR